MTLPIALKNSSADTPSHEAQSAQARSSFHKVNPRSKNNVFIVPLCLMGRVAPHNSRVPPSIGHFAIEWGQDAAEVLRICQKKAPLS
jgi:hypothetical protein